MRLGVLDVGSNTVHLLVVDAYQGARPVPAYSHKAELRLGDHLDSANRLSRECAVQLRAFVDEALQVAEDKGVQQLFAFATSAVRDAVNGDEILARIGGAAPSSDGPYVRRLLHHPDVTRLADRLARTSAADRAQLPGVSRGRAPQLAAGAIVADAAMDLLGLPELEICPWALREGVILRRLDTLPEGIWRNLRAAQLLGVGAVGAGPGAVGRPAPAPSA